MSTTKGALRERVLGDTSFPLAADENMRSINNAAFHSRGRSQSSISLSQPLRFRQFSSVLRTSFIETNLLSTLSVIFLFRSALNEQFLHKMTTAVFVKKQYYTSFDCDKTELPMLLAPSLPIDNVPLLPAPLPELSVSVRCEKRGV